jgi:gas vesicle protein
MGSPTLQTLQDAILRLLLRMQRSGSVHQTSSMTKSELKSKIKQLADELHEEHRLTNMMEQEKARHRRKILQSVGHLRGGSTSSTQVSAELAG